MKSVAKLFLLLSLIHFGCNSESHMDRTVEYDAEMELVNLALSVIIPENPPCAPVMIENESTESYNKRLAAFYHKIDSVGKKIEVISKLVKLDTTILNYRLKNDTTLQSKLLTNSPREDRIIDQALISELQDVKIVFVKAPRESIGGLTDCNTLGQITFSRVGFNNDSTEAAIQYFIDDGSSTGWAGGIILAKRSGRKWKLIE